MAAFTGAVVLVAGRRRRTTKEAIKKMPWGVIVMVCGVTVLIGVLEKTQGMSICSPTCWRDDLDAGHGDRHRSRSSPA